MHSLLLIISHAFPPTASLELPYLHHLLFQVFELVLYVVLPLLNNAVLRFDQLKGLEDALVRFLDKVEDGEGLENVQGHVAHVSVKTDQGLQGGVTVKVNLLLLNLNLYSIGLGWIV